MLGSTKMLWWLLRSMKKRKVTRKKNIVKTVYRQGHILHTFKESEGFVDMIKQCQTWFDVIKIEETHPYWLENVNTKTLFVLRPHSLVIFEHMETYCDSKINSLSIFYSKRESLGVKYNLFQLILLAFCEVRCLIASKKHTDNFRNI